MKQIAFYNVQFGIEDKVPAQEDFDRSIREKQLLNHLDFIFEHKCLDKGLSRGDVLANLGVAVLQGGKHQRVCVQGDISVASIHHVKDSALIFRNSFNQLIRDTRDGNIITMMDDADNIIIDIDGGEDKD